MEDGHLDAHWPMFARYEPRSARPADTPLHPFIICRAQAMDVDDLARLVQRREGGEFNRHRQRFEADLEAGERQCFVLTAKVDRSLAGFARAHRFEPPPEAVPETAPAGWYLSGLLVQPASRRLGIGLALTLARLDWISQRAPCAYYFANARNQATIDLHTKCGFVEVTRRFAFPGAL